MCSSAGLYLLNMRQFDLDKECLLREQVTKDTPFGKVEAYLIKQFSAFFGMIDVYFFGSRVTGVAQNDADLDVCIKARSGLEDMLVFSKAVDWAEAKPSEIQIERKIPEGPLLLRVHITTLNLTVDLTFDSGYSVATSKLVSHYFDMQPFARKMHVCLKDWKSLTNISQRFHTHVLTRLIVFFMQQRNYLPAVERVLVGPLDQINLLNVEFYPNENFTLSYPKDFFSLIKDFFAYWNQFDWSQNGICVLNGMVKPREWFRFHTDRTTEPSMMSSDYFNQARNASRGVDVGDFESFRMACQEAERILNQKDFI
ncbi:terminal uridylyltransferase Tailor-like [Sabethes cyaneus]|uniref:terminal uridylyltransferase Tailor-like n=1 Tax=Sabethes cyaneus TaxID=53552 RepID=UPI00237EAEF6|nr:terminal uridylyltransferase Tailor-like [Sabethes cyaneus]